MEVLQTLCIKTKATTNANTKSRTSKGSYNMIQFRNLGQGYFTNNYLNILKCSITYLF